MMMMIIIMKMKVNILMLIKIKKGKRKVKTMMKTLQKKSAAHIIINNLKINKDKERSNTNIHRNKIYASEKKNNNENNIQN